VTELERRPRPIVDAVLGFRTSPAPGGDQVGRWAEAVATRLGVVDVTVLAVRPDRYIGLRDDTGDAAVVDTYLDGLVS
jgi:hypothetical protein